MSRERSSESCGSRCSVWLEKSLALTRSVLVWAALVGLEVVFVAVSVVVVVQVMVEASAVALELAGGGGDVCGKPGNGCISGVGSGLGEESNLFLRRRS